MGKSQDTWVVGATVLLESSWLFAVLGVAGAALGWGGSPVSWPGLIGIMGVSAAIVGLGPSKTGWRSAAYRYRALVGVASVYLVAGIQLAEGFGPDLGWAVSVVSGSAEDGHALEAAAAAVVGLLLWWRAGALASAKSPTRSLAVSFRVGMPVLALATILDIAQSADLHTGPMVFIFFASGLTGLTIGHLAPDTGQSAKARRWPRTIAALVSGVLLVGLAASLLQRDFLSSVTGALKALVAAILWAIFIPIALALDAFMNALLGFFDRPFEPETSQFQEQAREGFNRFPEALGETGEEEEQAVETAVNFFEVAQWALLAVAVLLVAGLILYLLVRASRHSETRRPGQGPAERESIREGADLALDLARLLWGLTPGWLKGGGRRTGFGVPEGPRGIVEALRIYYSLVATAEKRGFRRSPHETATEFQRTLEGVFPRDLVRMSTAAFNRAFYGHHPATDEEVAHMRSSLKGLASGAV